MTIQAWKENSQGGESMRRITDKEARTNSSNSLGCPFCEKQMVGTEPKCPVCGKAIKTGILARIWRTFQKTFSFLTCPFLQVHYFLASFFHRTAKRFARPGFERRLEFILGFTLGLGIVFFLIILGIFALYGNHASYFLTPKESGEPVLPDIESTTTP